MSRRRRPRSCRTRGFERARLQPCRRVLSSRIIRGLQSAKGTEIIRAFALDLDTSVSIASQPGEIRERITPPLDARAATPDDIALMAVCKTFPAAAILEAYARWTAALRREPRAGIRRQISSTRRTERCRVPHDRPPAIEQGAKAAEIFHAVDSIDSAKLAQRLNDAAAKTRQDARRPDRNQRRRRRSQERPRARFARDRGHP